MFSKYLLILQLTIIVLQEMKVKYLNIVPELKLERCFEYLIK